MLSKILPGALFLAVMAIMTACHKESDRIGNPPIPPSFPAKKVLYIVRGTNFILNFIDSNSVFQTGVQIADSFHYEFRKGPGAGIGMSIYLPTKDDSVYFWGIYIDGKLYADAYSSGGAYLTVPY